jgi:uncharacterized protein YneF (UPF0154 family)
MMRAFLAGVLVGFLLGLYVAVKTVNDNHDHPHDHEDSP